MIIKAFPGKNDQELLSQIEAIFSPKYRLLTSIFELCSDKDANDFDEAVLKAFLKANEKSYMANLCLSWNRVDIVRNFILNDQFKEDVRKSDCFRLKSID